MLGYTTTKQEHQSVWARAASGLLDLQDIVGKLHLLDFEKVS